MTTRRKRTRDMFGALLSNVQYQRTNKRLANANVPQACACACIFGLLPPDLVCVVLQHVIALSNLSCGLELWEAATQSVVNMESALGSCAYLWRCFREHGEILRLEIAARCCTSLMPTNAASETPYFDQVMLEERSRFDVRMLESALNALVCHCAGEHCRGARRAHNESIFSTKNPQTPLLETVLAGRRPRIKVVWPSGVVGMAASVHECVLALRPRAQPEQPNFLVGSLLALKDEQPDVFNPNTELHPVRRLELSTHQRCTVDQITTSPCGQWIALLKEVLIFFNAQTLIFALVWA